MEDGAGAQGPKHCHNLLETLLANAFAFIFLLAKGLDLMQP